MKLAYWDPSDLNEQGLLKHNHVHVHLLELRNFVNRVLGTISSFSYQKQVLLLTIDAEQLSFDIEKVASNRLRMQRGHVAFILHSNCSLTNTFGLLEDTSVGLRVKTELAIIAIRDSFKGPETNLTPPVDMNLLMVKFLSSINKKHYPETIEELLEYLNRGSDPDLTYWIATNYAFYFGSLH